MPEHEGAWTLMGRVSEELRRLRGLISDLDAIVWEGDPETFRFNFVSERAREILGYEPSEWVKDPEFWGAHVHPDDRAKTIERCRAAVADGRDWDVQYRFTAADGSVIWIRDLVHIVKDTGGAPAALRGLMVDITKQKLGELRLEEAKGKYQALVERLPAIVYSKAGDAAISQVSYISPQAERILGYPISTWFEDPALWARILHPDDRDRVLRQLERSIKDQRPFASEHRVMTADGETAWLRDEAVPIRDEHGLLLSWQGVMLDVTSQQRMEDKLRGAEQRYKTLLEQAPVVTYLDEFEAVAGTIYISPQIEELLGYPPEEWVSDPDLWGRILHLEDRDWVISQSRRHDHTLEPYSIEYRMIARDGSVVWVHDWAVVVHNDAGQPRYWQGVMVDITGEKRSEELEEELEAERESASRLREVDEMRNTFIQAVSHDLRTPLAAILGLAVTLERDDVELSLEETRDMAGRIAANARKLDRLVNDLLDLDRLGRGIAEPHLEPTDLGELVWRQVSESGLLKERRVHVETEPVVVDVDRAMVERTIDNLLSNTARHTPAGATIWVRLLPAEKGVMLVVEDDGPGVPPSERTSIFEPFRRSDEPSDKVTDEVTPEVTAGVGLGLALVARFAELHGGRAWVEEREGGGASFRVFLSAAEPPKRSAEPPKSTAKPPRAGARPRKGSAKSSKSSAKQGRAKPAAEPDRPS